MPKKKISPKKKTLKRIIKKLKKNNFKFNLIEMLAIIVVSISLGALLGGAITYNKENVTITKVPKELDEFVSTYNNIYNNYYKKVKKQDLVDAAIEGMINSLEDPYSNYMNEDTTETFNQTVDGEYVGIGVTVVLKEEYAEIADIFSSSPAAKSGLKVGDKIIKIDKTDLKNKSLTEVTKLVKGKPGTKISMKVLRGEKELTFNIKRKSISIPSVTSKIIEKDQNKVGYISIDVFAANTYNQFAKELKKLESKKINSLIIDVRNNPGGHLNQVTKILELFLGKNKVLYQIKTQTNIQKIYSTTNEKRNYKVAVLINKSSASASEILASAIKESYQGEVIGVNSYGKGTVQKAYELSDGTSLKYTTQKWLTPKGKWINEKGVTPTEKVELDEKYNNDPTEENDNQLQKALEILTK